MGERWYRFTQVEVLPRAYWCKGTSAADAKRRAGYSGQEGVPDYAGHPSSIRIVGRGELVRDQDEIACIESRERELDREVGG
jgi:hypothetical protein